MKTILELLLKLGWEVPTWVFVVLFVLVILGLLFVFIKKQIVPLVYKAVKIKKDIDSISEIRDKQVKIMEESIEGDKELEAEVNEIREDLFSLHDKLDQIADTLQSLCDKEEQEGMSRAQNRLLEMYKKFYLNNEAKTWTKYESEVFFNTLESYTSHGGNSFILEEVTPKMKLLNIVEE